MGRVGARTNRIRWPRTRGRPVGGRANPPGPATACAASPRPARSIARTSTLGAQLPLVRGSGPTPRSIACASTPGAQLPLVRGSSPTSRAPTGLRRTTPRSTRCSGRWARSASRSSWASPQARRREGSRGLLRPPQRARRSKPTTTRVGWRPRSPIWSVRGAHRCPSSRARSACAAKDELRSGRRLLRPRWRSTSRQPKGARRAATSMTFSTSRPRARGRAGPTRTWLVRSRKAQEAATVMGMTSPRTTAMGRQGAPRTWSERGMGVTASRRRRWVAWWSWTSSAPVLRFRRGPHCSPGWSRS